MYVHVKIPKTFYSKLGLSFSQMKKFTDITSQQIAQCLLLSSSSYCVACVGKTGLVLSLRMHQAADPILIVSRRVHTVQEMV